MMLMIQKNSRLGLQLLIGWLMLGIGLLADKTEGFKCHSCEGDACKTDEGVECESGFCEKITEGATVKMKCSDSAKEAKCIMTTFDKSCYIVNDDNKAKLTTCMEEEGLGSTAQQLGLTICSCNSSLCNGIEEKTGSNTDSDITPVETNNSMSDSGGRQLIKNLKCYECLGEEECKNLGKKISCYGVCANYKYDGVTKKRKCSEEDTIHEFSCYDKFSDGCVDTKDDKIRQETLDCLRKAKKKKNYYRENYERDISNKVSWSDYYDAKVVLECKCDTDLCNFGQRNIPFHHLIYLGLLIAIGHSFF